MALIPLLALLADQLAVTLVARLAPEWVASGASLLPRPALPVLACLLAGAWLGAWRLGRLSAGALLAGAGALSNLLTVWRFGAVIDYIPLGFAVANLADLMIGIGLAWWAHDVLGGKEKARPEPR